MSIHRVALISPYALSVFGGVQEQVLAMSRELERRGVSVLVVTPDVSDDADYDTPATVQHFGALASVPANGSRAPLTLSLAASSRARDAVRSFAPDVVHFHEPFAPVLGYRTLTAHEYPSVATFHRGGGGPAYSLTAPLLRRLARGVDVAAAVSLSAATTVRDGAGISARVLFNGFETERFRTFPKERGVPPVIFYVGRLEERKGVATLVGAAIEHERRSGVPWRVIVAGDGPLRAELERSDASTRAVEFVGAISERDKRQWQRRSDVCVAPSLRGESFGLVVLEAMASESRAVVADIDGYRDAAAGHAVLFTPGDSASLHDAIEEALVPNDAAIAAARAHAETWSMARLVDEYLDLYAQAHVAAGRSR